MQQRRRLPRWKKFSKKLPTPTRENFLNLTSLHRSGVQSTLEYILDSGRCCKRLSPWPLPPAAHLYPLDGDVLQLVGHHHVLLWPHIGRRHPHPWPLPQLHPCHTGWGEHSSPNIVATSRSRSRPTLLSSWCSIGGVDARCLVSPR